MKFITLTLAAIPALFASSSAFAIEAVPYISLVSQKLTPTYATPISIKQALMTNLEIEIESYSDWGSDTLDLKLNRDSQPIRIVKGQVSLPADYPADLPKPTVIINGQTLKFRISGLNAILHPSFEISTQVSSPEGESSPWISFRDPVKPLVAFENPIDLATTGLAHATLDQWIEALLQETVKPMGNNGVVRLQVTMSDGMMVLPLLLVQNIGYSPDLASYLAQSTQDAMDKLHFPPSKLVFGIEIFHANNSFEPWVSLAEVELDLNRVIR